jgi:hypothetical protein
MTNNFTVGSSVKGEQKVDIKQQILADLEATKQALANVEDGGSIYVGIWSPVLGQGRVNSWGHRGRHGEGFKVWGMTNLSDPAQRVLHAAGLEYDFADKEVMHTVLAPEPLVQFRTFLLAQGKGAKVLDKVSSKAVKFQDAMTLEYDRLEARMEDAEEVDIKRAKGQLKSKFERRPGVNGEDPYLYRTTFTYLMGEAEVRMIRKLSKKGTEILELHLVDWLQEPRIVHPRQLALRNEDLIVGGKHARIFHYAAIGADRVAETAAGCAADAAEEAAKEAEILGDA